MESLRSFCWMLFGAGLTLFLTQDNAMVQRVGSTLMLVTLLARWLIYLREHQPSWERINAVGEPRLSIVESLPAESGLPVQPMPVSASAMVSPVQKLIDEDR